MDATDRRHLALACQQESKPAPVEVDDNAPWFGNAAHDVEELTDDLENSPLDADPVKPRSATLRLPRVPGPASVTEKPIRRIREVGSEGVSTREWRVGAAEGEPPLLWSISLNRRARPAIKLSVSSTKADASPFIFNVKCRT